MKYYCERPFHFLFVINSYVTVGNVVSRVMKALILIAWEQKK